MRLTVQRIRELSPILRDLESAGKIQIAGCIYDLESGRVRFTSTTGASPALIPGRGITRSRLSCSVRAPRDRRGPRPAAR